MRGDPLECVGSVHVPGCSHTGALVKVLGVSNKALEDLLPPSAVVAAATGGLTLAIEVGIRRIGRKRCPTCHRLRIVFALSAYSASQPIGYGRTSCLECADLRRR